MNADGRGFLNRRKQREQRRDRKGQRNHWRGNKDERSLLAARGAPIESIDSAVAPRRGWFGERARGLKPTATSRHRSAMRRPTLGVKSIVHAIVRGGVLTATDWGFISGGSHFEIRLPGLL